MILHPNETDRADLARRDPLYQPGQIVSHRRYGYRGVVVGSDERCAAADGWYKSNQTQPIRDQHWYHVLVHESHQTTYAAEENLTRSEDLSQIAHPLLERYFDAFVNGKYQRNERPWGE